jgi:hypothetical protein
MSGRTAPVSLKIVAWLFILIGALAYLDVIIDLARNEIDFNYNLLGLIVGPGLIHYSRICRICCLIYLWFWMICLPLIAILAAFKGDRLTLSLDTIHFGDYPIHYAFIPILTLFVTAVWMYRVLVRPDVRALFGLCGDPSIDQAASAEDE